MEAENISLSEPELIVPEQVLADEGRKGSTNFKWPKAMSRFLILFLAKHVRNGVKCDKGFKNPTINAAIKALQQAFPNTPISEHNLTNHIRTLKSRWREIKTLQNLSEVSWDENRKMIIMGEEQYKAYIPAHLKHEPYLNKPIDLYEEMSLICSNDQATGARSKSLFQNSQSPGSRLDRSSFQLGPINLDQFISSDSNPSDAQSHEVSPVSSIKPKDRKQKGKRKATDGIEVMKKVAEQIGMIAVALTTDVQQTFADNLYKEIMALEGYALTSKSAAYDFLLSSGNEYLARGFLSRGIEMRRVWMDEFLMNQTNAALNQTDP